jgi:hypothetical protein
MSYSNPSNSYSEFGFESETQQQTPEKSNDYSEFGFEGESPKQKEKVGKAKSLLYGLAEGVLGVTGLLQYGANELSKGLEPEGTPEIPFEKENPILSYMSKFPESEDQTSRRIRTGASGAITGSIAGVPGIVAGIVGSQAGQTIRELFGKEGKFEKFGVGEVSAIGADILSGGISGIATSLAKGSKVAASQVPAVFRQGTTALEKASIKNVVQGEKNALQNIVDSFGRSQIEGFEKSASAVSPNRFTELTKSDFSGLQRNADNMFRENNLSLISPLQVTPEQGGRAIQESANMVFQDTVINAEKQAYAKAREAAKDLSGSAPETLKEAKKLRDSLISTSPSGEQNPVVNYLSNLISDLETTTPSRTIPASKLIGPNGLPLIAEETIEATTEATKRSANELIDMVQKGNYAVNYESELREQSHRLIPIINTLRRETGSVLNKDPKAANLYLQANNLHGKNAETWGTRYMKQVRFTENPESIIAKTEQASNMKNLKQAIPDPGIQAITERLVIDKMTQSGSSKSNIQSVHNLSPELSHNAKNAAQELINVKDPLTSVGGRAQVRNEILKDTAQSINTGKRPEKILNLMETPKGYMLVKEALSHSPQSREAFKAFERLFIEDIFSSITDSSGKIDFGKASNILKNGDVRQVTEMIGGKGLVSRFEELANFATSFEKNMALYSNPQTQSLFKSLAKNVKDAGFMGTVLHALHVPWPIIVGLGLGKATVGGLKLGYSAMQSKLLSNPQAMKILESISKANTVQELEKQVPRLISEIGKKTENE